MLAMDGQCHGMRIERDCPVVPQAAVRPGAAKHPAIGSACGAGAISDDAQRLRQAGSSRSVRACALPGMATGNRGCRAVRSES